MKSHEYCLISPCWWIPNNSRSLIIDHPIKKTPWNPQIPISLPTKSTRKRYQMLLPDPCYIIPPRILTGCTCVPPPWCERSTSAKAWAWVAWTKHGFRDPIEELLIGAVAAKPRSVYAVQYIDLHWWLSLSKLLEILSTNQYKGTRQAFEHCSFGKQISGKTPI